MRTIPFSGCGKTLKRTLVKLLFPTIFFLSCEKQKDLAAEPPLTFPPPTQEPANTIQPHCECVEWVKRETGIKPNDHIGDAYATGPALIAHGFTEYTEPQINDVVVFQKEYTTTPFGSPSLYGHIAIVRAITNNPDGTLTLNIEGANQNAKDEYADCSCGNVSKIDQPVTPLNNQYVKYYRKSGLIPQCTYVPGKTPLPATKGRGGSGGDCHIYSFDNQYYDFQGKGEFEALASTFNNLMIQVRQSDLPGYFSKQVTLNTAIAIRYGPDTVQFQMDPFKLLVNKKQIDMNTQYDFTDQGYIYTSNNSITIQLGSGDYIVIRYFSKGYFDYEVNLVDGHQSRISGLLGNWDNNNANDVSLSSDSIINPHSFKSMYPSYSNHLRIDQEESLFFYEPGKSTLSYTDLNFPYTEIIATNEQMANATQACQNAGVTKQPFLCNCTTDVIATQNNDFIESAMTMQTEFAANDLIVDLPLDGYASDVSGYNNHGIISGEVLPAMDRKGNTNSAMAFNESNSNGKGFISLPNTPTLAGLAGQATVLAWVTVKNWYSNWGSVVCKSQGTRGTLQMQFTKNYLYSDAGVYVNIDPPFVQDTWYQVGIVIDGSVRRFYLNGKRIGEGQAVLLTPNSYALEFGRDMPGQVEYHIGKMDDIKVYSRALTDAEILTLYDE